MAVAAETLMTGVFRISEPLCSDEVDFGKSSGLAWHGGLAEESYRVLDDEASYSRLHRWTVCSLVMRLVQA